MKILRVLLMAIVTAIASSLHAAPMGTAFTYQGKLQDSGAPANGIYDFDFKLFDGPNSPTQIGSTISQTLITVSNGIFTVKLDFGNQFPGDSRWLEIWANTNAQPVVKLGPRQELTPQPYALTAENVHGSVAAGQLTGTLPAGLLSGTYGNALTLNNASNSLSGNGAGLTGLNASQLISGTVADARLSANVALLNASQTFSGLNSFSGNISLLDPTKSVTFPNTSGANAPMINMFVSSPFPLGNVDRMVLAQSPSNPNWGLQFQDVSRRFNFLAGGFPVLSVDLSNGRVGIGTTSPTDAKLDVEGNIRVNDNPIYLRSGTDRNHGLAWSNSVSGISIDGPFLWGYDGGALGAVSSSAPDVVALKWDYGGNVWVSNNCSVGTLTIRGGADLAEPFKIVSGNEEITPGAVVVIDAQHPGQLKMSDRSYDTHVAGVVSGANGVNAGIQMQQQGLLEGGRNVALSGRVYVQADASNGRIEPGDLLTTSSRLGHAMKVTNHTRAQGAILGKAMTGLSKGEGMVLVLVTLQ